jgi:hypothetical protein
MPTSKRGWPLPTQETQPPDVVKWLGDLGDAVDNTFQWGPAASVPATLPPGTLYFGHE